MRIPQLVWDLGYKRARDSIAVDSGEVNHVTLSAFSVMRNEMYFLPAYFHHYRSLGVKQFVILDDKSTDGTREFLTQQKDCVVLSSPFRFGDMMYPSVAGKGIRAGQVLKGAIADRFLRNQLVIHSDADEFLVLPEGITIEAAANMMSHEDVNCVLSSIVEMYPKSILDICSNSVPPHSIADLLEIAPYFDAAPLVNVRAETPLLRKIGTSATNRLFSLHNIFDGRESTRQRSRWRKLLLQDKPNSSVTEKVNLFHLRGETRLLGSNYSSTPCSTSLLFALLHFKFTPDLARRIRAATTELSHAGNSAKYFKYRLLFERMQQSGLMSFLGPNSVQWESVSDLEAAGLCFSASGGEDSGCTAVE